MRPVFQSVIDLGLRDVGVKNEPRRLAAHFGRMSVPVVVAGVLFLVVTCLLLHRAGADSRIVAATALTLTIVVLAAGLRTITRTPLVVLKVTADGKNHLTWLLVAHFVLLVPVAAMTATPLVIPPMVVALLVTLLGLRGRGRVPELLRELRSLLAADESVLGDGVGRLPDRRADGLRLVVATDRRLLVVGPKQPAPIVDLPYEYVSRFAFEWKFRGRVGDLSLTVAGVGGAPSDTHVVSFIGSGNLLSIVRALHSHGVATDDPAAISEAERGWEEALQRGRSQRRWLDRAAMSTREFDHGLWLLMGLAAVIFYANPFGIGLGASRDAVPTLLAVPALCFICGAVSRTPASLAYLVPLNLLVAPAFFFADAGDVIGLMFLLSTLAMVGLWMGAALRAATGGAVSAGRRAARGSLRYTLSGLGLIRISSMMLAAMVALVMASAAAGFELTDLGLGLEQATATKLPVDGRSNLSGNAASFSYTPGRDLVELVTDEAPLAGPYDGARWELRSSFTKGYNALTLGHYVVEPRLEGAAAVADFLAAKDRAHSRLAGFPVTHTERVVDGRKGYVWNHGSRDGTWYYAAWFPQPVHSVRVECIAKRQKGRFKRLCAEAMRSLKFNS